MHPSLISREIKAELEHFYFIDQSNMKIYFCEDRDA